MKRHFFRFIFLAALFFIFSGCNSDSRANPRVYIEGKVVSATVDYRLFFLRIKSENAVMAETMLEDGGKFKLSGPVSGGPVSLTSTEKIRSFSADKAGLKISPDSLEILIPAGNTYIIFNEIILQK